MTVRRRPGLLAPLLVLALAAAAPAAAHAASGSGYAKLGAYCQAHYPPGYGIPVYWGQPPALYCTDDIGSPSHSYGPFTADDACSWSGYGPADPDYAKTWGAVNFSPGIHCGPYDKTPPTITITTPGGGSTYLPGSHHTVAYSCADADSGVASCVGSQPNGKPLDTSYEGPHVFTVTARDNDGNTTTKSVRYTVPADRVSVTLDPGSVAGDGAGIVTATITDTAPDGSRVAGRDLRIEPPLSYDVPAVACDTSNRFLYPTRLNDGSLLGAGFTRPTDDKGEVRVTFFTGTAPGDFELEAGEPGEPRADWGHAAMSVSEAGGATALRTELPALLVAASDKTLADFQHPGLSDVLSWLGTLRTGPDKGVLAGVRYAPIHATDPSGTVHTGVVLYADGSAARGRVLSYLDGSSAVVPDEGEAIVIDVAKMDELLYGTRLAGHDVNTVGYRLPSLQEWREGARVDIGENAKGQPRFLPIPGRGRAIFGFPGPRSNEDLLYGYGPYPPRGADAATQAGFAKCIGYTFGTTTISVHSPIRLLVTGAHGRRAGVTAKGRLVDTIPGAIVNHTGAHVTSVIVHNGSWGVQVVGTGRGRARLVVVNQSAAGSATRLFSFAVKRDQRGALSVGRTAAKGSMRFAGHRLTAAKGLGLKVAGLPRRLAVGKAGTWRLTVRDEFGARVAGVAVTIGGTAGATAGGVTDRRGRIALAVHATKAGHVTARVSGRGYRTLRRTITAR